MRHGTLLFASGTVLVTAVMVIACGSSNPSSGFSSNDAGQGGSSNSGGGSGSSSGSFGDDGSSLVGDGSTTMQDSGSPMAVAVVYAHSADTLYRLNPMNNQVAVVGPFNGCDQVIDIAIDQNSNGYVTTSSGFYKVDLTTAACTHIADGNYPNSLSFVPKGTLDPNAEALVGFVDSTYIRINETTGAITNVGMLTGGYSSSGDVVSVIGGGTFLTVKGGNQNCNDCLLQVDPKTGALIQNYGSVNHSDVFGLAFWAGTAYGFDNGGEVFSIDYQGGSLVTMNIPVPNPPPNLSFWGAGSTTAAPPTSADGGGFPVQ